MSYEESVSNDTNAPLYARFSRRFRGIFFDWLLMLVAIFGALFLATAVGNGKFSRVLGFFIVAAALLYEPVLVSLTGGTVGHHLTNLRVVDDHSRGNVSFLKAVARAVTKDLLGWYSFIVILATRRNQALHDLLTRSTVQIRDRAKATPHQYISERTDFRGAEISSRLHRLAVICGYLLLTFGIVTGAFAVMMAAGVMSSRCTNSNVCSSSENILSLTVGVSWLVAIALVIGLGWRGRLFGARRKPGSGS